MSNNIQVTGKNALDLDLRTKALKILSDLPSNELEFLGQLAKSEKARKKFMANKTTIKLLTGI